VPLLSHSLALDYQLPYYQRHSFHHLRHTAVHAVYEATRDLLLVQRFVRHSSLLVTSVYLHPTDEDLARSVQKIRC